MNGIPAPYLSCSTNSTDVSNVVYGVWCMGRRHFIVALAPAYHTSPMSSLAEVLYNPKSRHCIERTRLFPILRCTMLVRLGNI